MASVPENTADWFYVGYYGQLGPLTLAQIEELIQDGVITTETYVWKVGMPQWEVAPNVPALQACFHSSPSLAIPPPPPSLGLRPDAPAPFRSSLAATPFNYMDARLPVSDRNRILAGVLQLLIPGSGRIYLGYAAQGVIQLLLVPFGCGIGWIWSVVDGLTILSGSVKLDGYGRRLSE